jgi:hypothetical protein
LAFIREITKSNFVEEYTAERILADVESQNLDKYTAEQIEDHHTAIRQLREELSLKNQPNFEGHGPSPSIDTGK